MSKGYFLSGNSGQLVVPGVLTADSATITHSIGVGGNIAVTGFVNAVQGFSVSPNFVVDNLGNISAVTLQTTGNISASGAVNATADSEFLGKLVVDDVVTGLSFTSTNGFNIAGGFLAIDNVGNIGTNGGLDAGGAITTASYFSADDYIVGGGLYVATTAVAVGNLFGILALGNGATPPTTSVDLVQMYAQDISAGHTTLGVFTEQAVAVDVALASTNSLTIFINGLKYKIPLVFVP